MTAPDAVDVRPPSLRGKDLADMTAVQLQAVVYAQRDCMRAMLISDAELQAACRAHWSSWDRMRPDVQRAREAAMRRALEAAALARCGGAQ